MSDDRDKLMRMLRDGQRAARSRAAAASALAGATVDTTTATTANIIGDGADATASPLDVTTDLTGSMRRRRDGNGGAAGGATHLNAADSLQEFLAHYYRLFSAFAEDSMRHELVLDRELTAYDRHVLHDLAQACGLNHLSRGDGDSRTLVLQKDALFYGNPNQHERVNLDEIEERIKGKTSKYDVRHVRTHALGHRGGSPPPATGQVGSYADEDAVRKIERFLRATDEYRHAQHMGYSQEDAEAEAVGGHAATLEDILRGKDESHAEGAPQRRMTFVTATPRTTAVATGTGAMPPNASTHPLATTATTNGAAAYNSCAPVVSKEVCKSCGARADLDGDRSRWQCLHYCAHCAKSTIWVLEEDTGAAVAAAAGKANSRSTCGGHGVRRTRGGQPIKDTESVEMYGSQGPLPLDVSAGDDEEEKEGVDGGGDQQGRKGRLHALSIDRSDFSDMSDAEEVTVDDVVDTAAINDFSDADTDWIRGFALSHRDELKDYVIFCIEFSDLMRARIFLRHDLSAAAAVAASVSAPTKRARQEHAPCTYVVVRGLGASSAAGPVHVTALIDKVRAAVVAVTGVSDTASLAVAFKNLSVYGVEATAICQLRGCPPEPALSALAGLVKEYGSRRVFVAKDLAEAVTHATAE